MIQKPVSCTLSGFYAMAWLNWYDRQIYEQAILSNGLSTNFLSTWTCEWTILGACKSGESTTKHAEMFNSPKIFHGLILGWLEEKKNPQQYESGDN